jgi:hypothetical protein
MAMGLYDSPVGALDPRAMAMMTMGSALMRGPSMTPISFGGSLGQAGMQGLQAFQQAQQANQQQQLFNMKLAEAKREEDERAQKKAALAELMKDPRFAGLPPALMKVAPQIAIDRAIPKPKEQANPFSRLNPKDYTRDSLVKFQETGNVADLVAAAPVKEPTETELAKALRERDALPPNDPNRALYDAKIKKLTTHQPGTSVTVAPDNLGLKPKDRFDMEDKLRNDYRSNPVVKSADEMWSAFKLIETARKTPSPANDLAMATKYMKILDPNSVVRESELALAMNATGMLDKVQNYADMIITGKKLNPNQREDFYKSAKAINDAFQNERAGIAERFTQNAKQYNLTPENVVGSPKAQEKPAKDPQVDDWISRAMKKNMVSRAVALKEGKRLGKVPEDYE